MTEPELVEVSRGHQIACHLYRVVLRCMVEKLWNKKNGMHNQCHEQGLGKISRRCFPSAAASAAGFALAGPALAERMVRPREARNSTDACRAKAVQLLARSPSPVLTAAIVSAGATTRALSTGDA